MNRFQPSVRTPARLKTGLLAALALVLAGCGSSPQQPVAEKPAWVSQLPERAGYVYGVGSADNTGSAAGALDSARERARVDLIRQMEVQISSEFTSNTELQLTGGRTTAFVEQVQETIGSRIPEVELPDLTWSDTWVDPASKTQYALAELNRRAAEAKLMEQLSALDLELENKSLPAKVNAQGEPVSRIDQVRQAVPVLALFAERDKLIQQLKFVAETDFERFIPDEDLLQLRRDLQALIASLRIALSPGNGDARLLESSLAEEMTRQGLRLSTDAAAAADLRLTYTLDMSRREQNRTHYVFARSAVQIRDSNNRIMGAFDREAKGVSGLESRAKALAVKQLGGILSAEVIDALFIVEY